MASLNDDVIHSPEPPLSTGAYRPGEVPIGYDWAAHWQDEPAGICRGCQRWANTPGPDGYVWHAFCWLFPLTDQSWRYQWAERFESPRKPPSMGGLT